MLALRAKTEADEMIDEQNHTRIPTGAARWGSFLEIRRARHPCPCTLMISVRGRPYSKSP
uniref:Uncharacterized protein n=1 Tax=Candidatus Kentrum sp. LFY TaxID=2126342 RepID=A0A450V180_9GAMM|nr:MAG: hypothetical protein BECKLFY1418B_GA0070995_11234 [Candidatus Kentron sp. LFY]